MSATANCDTRRVGIARVLMLSALSALALVISVPSAVATAANTGVARLTVPADARQLIVVSSPTDVPAGYLAMLRTYARSGPLASWQPVAGPWQAETGSGHLVAADARREGDDATPIGVFGIGATVYGIEPRPPGLHTAYRRLVCGDWWQEDPFTPRYNELVHAPCGVTPDFAAWSEALWTETVAYPYFAVIRFNVSPTIAGAAAPGSGIFLHSWVSGPTQGCVALPLGELLTVLRWLRPAEHPAIEIATDAELSAGL